MFSEHIYTLKKTDVRIFAVKVIRVFARKGGIAAEQSCSVVVCGTQAKAGFVHWRTRVSACRCAGWLALGRGAYSNKHKEDAEGEREGMHLLCDGLGKRVNKKRVARGTILYALKAFREVGTSMQLLRIEDDSNLYCKLNINITKLSTMILQNFTIYKYSRYLDLFRSAAFEKYDSRFSIEI